MNSRIIWILLYVGIILPLFFFSLLPSTTTAAPTSALFSLPEQFAIFSTAFIIKPLYMAVSLAIAFLLRAYAAPEMVAIRRAMIAFFMGEAACAANFIFFNESSVLMEYWHNYGMVVCFSLVAYALMEALDERVFNFSTAGRKCVLLPLCGSCYKQGIAGCNLKLLFLYLIPAAMVLAAIPLAAPLHEHIYVGNIFGTAALFGHPLNYQIMEARFFPILSIFFLGVSFTLLLVLKEKGFAGAKMFFAIGLGALAFSLMRFLCYRGYGNNPLWADVWEELTELLFVIIVFRFTLQVNRLSEQSLTSKSLNPAKEGR